MVINKPFEILLQLRNLKFGRLTKRMILAVNKKKKMVQVECHMTRQMKGTYKIVIMYQLGKGD